MCIKSNLCFTDQNLMNSIQQENVNTTISQGFVCMRNEYFIHNQFIKIKYKII